MFGQSLAVKRLVVVGTIALALGAAGVVILAHYSSQFRMLLLALDGGDTEDQPPIIVRDGSIYLDGGDVLYPHPPWLDWESIGSSGSTTTYAPIHPHGAPPKGFEIIALNTVTTSSCPAAPVLADHLDLTYTGVGNAANTTAKIYITQSGGKPRAVFETSLPMNKVPMNGTNPGQLNYTTDGTLSGFTTTTVSGASISCNFDANQGHRAYLRVQQTR